MSAQPLYDDELAEVLAPPEAIQPEVLDLIVDQAIEQAGSDPELRTEYVRQWVLDQRNAEPDERFRITDEALAEWAMAHVRGIVNQRRANREQRDEWRARIDGWFDTREVRLSTRQAFFENHLTAFMVEYRALDPRHHKTLTLPSGALRSTEAKPKVEVVDDELLVRWLEEVAPDEVRDAALKVVKSVLVSELRKHATPALVEVEPEQVDEDTGDLHPARLEQRAVITVPWPADDDTEHEGDAHLVIPPELVQVTPTTVTYSVSPGKGS